MISVRVKFFGPLRDIVPQDDLTMELPDDCSGEAAFDQLVVLYPELGKWKQSVRLAVNLEYKQFVHGLHASDEVCFIPPISGG